MYRYLILFFSLILFFVPLFSWSASFVPVSLPCSHPIIADDSRESQPVVCPFCPSKGATRIKLRWEIFDKKYANPHCFISCTNKDNKSCGQIYYKTKEGLPSVGPEGPNAIRLGAFGEIYLTDLKDGQNYVVSCCEKCLPTTPREECPFPGICKLGTVESSAQAQIKKECREPCEVPFQTIADKLKTSQVVTITENDFNKWWTEYDIKDSVNWPTLTNETGIFDSTLGSGDWTDLKKFIESQQICMQNDSAENFHFSSTGAFDAITVMSPIITASNTFTPIAITVLAFEKSATTSNAVFSYGHAFVSLKTNLKNLTDLNSLGTASSDPIWDPSGTPFWSKTPPSDTFWIEVMDPNSLDLGRPAVFRLDCFKFLDKNHRIILLCPNPYDDRSFITLRNNSIEGIEPCNPRVRPKPTEWLRNNGQLMDNWSGFSSGSEEGVCWGVSNFFVKIACYGTFSGVDYHPGDNKYVGTDCDANHMPLRKTSFVGSDLVASVRLLIGKLFPTT